MQWITRRGKEIRVKLGRRTICNVNDVIGDQKYLSASYKRPIQKSDPFKVQRKRNQLDQCIWLKNFQTCLFSI